MKRTRYIDHSNDGNVKDYTLTDRKGGNGRNAEVDLRDYITGKLEACHRDFDTDIIVKRGVTMEVKISGGTLDYGMRYNGNLEMAQAMLESGDFRIGSTFIAYVEEYNDQSDIPNFRIMAQKRWIECALKHGMLYAEKSSRNGYNIRVRNPKTCNKKNKAAWILERETLGMTPDEFIAKYLLD